MKMFAGGNNPGGAATVENLVNLNEAQWVNTKSVLASFWKNLVVARHGETH